jgi:uncharacterized protein
LKQAIISLWSLKPKLAVSVTIEIETHQNYFIIDRNIVKMKIWLDTALKMRIGMDDCVAPVAIAPINFPPPEEEFLSIHDCMFKHAPSLYIQPCLDGKWLICNPIGSGRLAVLDSHAFLVFEKFRNGNTPSEIAHTMFEGSLATIAQLAAWLTSLGFLQNTTVTSLSDPEKKEDTLTAWLHVTNACNLRCHYCYISKTNEAMADDTAKRSVDAVMRSAVKHGFQRVMLKYAGGEASLQADSVFAIHDYAVEQARNYNLELHAQILSNGVFLSQRVIENIKQRNIGISISLDGVGTSHDSQRPFSSGKGSFKFVDQTVRRLLANAVIPHVLITVTQNNLPGMLDLMHYILDRELSFTISYYRDHECSTSRRDMQFGDEQMIATMHTVFALLAQRLPRQSLLNALIDKVNLVNTHHHTCGVGRNYLVIDQRGGVAKCQADIMHSVTTIDADDPLQLVKEDLKGIQNVPVEEKQGCRECTWRYWCTGGCPLLTYKATGRFDVKSPNCNIYQALIPEALKLEALRLLAYEDPFLIESDRYEICRSTLALL